MFLFSNILACTSDSINDPDTVKYDFNVYCHELAPNTVTGDRAQVDDNKQFNVLTVIGDLTKYIYSKTCVKRPLKNRQNKDLNNKW